MAINEETKKQIDDMEYESMLRRWRFAPLGDSMFMGEVGSYYQKVMIEKRNKVGAQAHTQTSKNIGWG